MFKILVIMVFKRKMLVIKSAMIHHHVIYTEIIGCMFFNKKVSGQKLQWRCMGVINFV